MVLADVPALKLPAGVYRWVWNTSNGFLLLIRAERLRLGYRVDYKAGGSA